MKLSQVLTVVEKDENCHKFLKDIRKTNKRTKALYLESLNRLAYNLYLSGDELSAKRILEYLAQIEFEGDYDYWTFIEPAISLLAFIEREDEAQAEHLREIILAPVEMGSRINKIVHQRFLEGQLLEGRKAQIEEAADEEHQIVYRYDLLAILMKLYLLRADTKFEEKDLRADIEQEKYILAEYLNKGSLYDFFPFKCR